MNKKSELYSYSTRNFNDALLIESNASSTSPIYVDTLSHIGIIETCKQNKFTASFTSGVSQHLKISSGVNQLVDTSCSNNVSGTKLRIDTTLSYNIMVNTINYNDSLGTVSFSMANTGYTRIAYSIYIDCSVHFKEDARLSTNGALLWQRWDDTTNTNNYLLPPGLSSNVDSISFNLPNVVVGSDTTISGSYLDTSFIIHKFYNNGFGNANMAFTFHPNISDSCARELLNLEYKIDSGVFTTITNDTSSCTLLSNQVLYIRETILVNNCLGKCQDAAYFSWHCKETIDSLYCLPCNNDTKLQDDIVSVDAPSIKLERVAPTLQTKLWDHSCPNDSLSMTQWIYRITKIGAGALDTLKFNLNSNYGNSDFVNYLTLIPARSLHITFSGNLGTRIVKDTIIFRNQYLCKDAIDSAVLNRLIYITDFDKTDTLLVEFSTYRCIEEDTVLLNKKKYYNQWGFTDLTKSTTICANPVIVYDANNFALSDLSLSTNAQDNSIPYDPYDVHLKLFFAPSISDLSVGHDSSGWGDSASMLVYFQGLMNNAYDYQLLGCSDTATSLCTLHGYMRAKIFCEQGLTVAEPQSHVSWNYVNAMHDTVRIAPVYYYTNVSGCDSGSFYFYFNLSDTSTLNLFNKGYFDYTLKSCCGANSFCCSRVTGKTKFNAMFYLLPDPSNSCITMNFTDTTHHNAPDSYAWLPLSDAPGGISVHCPGCLAPGVIVYTYNVKRLSYGLQDSNNDGIADSSGISIDQNSNWYAQNKSKLSLNYITAGDYVEDLTVARFQHGESAPGYTYPQMQADNSILRSLQLFRTIPGGLDPNVMGLLPIQVDLYIDSINSTAPTSECIDCNVQGIAGGYTTLLHFKADQQEIFPNILDTIRASGNFLYSFTYIDTLGVATGTLTDTSYIINIPLHHFSGFRENQHYRMVVKYAVLGRLTSPETPSTINEVMTQSEVHNLMYLSGKKQDIHYLPQINQMPNGIDTLLSLGWTFSNPDSTHQLIDQSFANKYLFYCETYGGFIYVVAQDVGTSNFPNQNYKKGCNYTPECTMGSTIGRNFRDFFPYEFRIPSLWMKYAMFNVPLDYEISKAYKYNFYRINSRQ